MSAGSPEPSTTSFRRNDVDQPIIRVRDLVKRFGPRAVCDGYSLDIPRGKTTVIMGGSGCGKSTLLKLMVGHLPVTSGHIYYDDEDITQLDDDAMDAVRRRFGILFQYGALFNSMTVGENVALPLREHTNLDEKIIQMMVKMKLELVGLRSFEDLLPSQISGGMKKRVGLARAIALDPEIVFYDEPSAGLDPITSAVVDKLIMKITSTLQVTSIVVTHHMDSAFKIADQMIMLDQGKIISEGTPDDIKNDPNPMVRQFIRGEPDGAIPLNRVAEEYIEDLLGVE